jgi:cyclic-di-GMP phosphodiesterase TipF (flagellum assembly factor)
MVRLGAIFIAVCMVLIAGSVGGVLFLALKVPLVLSALAALAALVLMVLYSTVSNRLRDRRIVGDQIADLSRGTGDLARQVAELNRRIGAMENRGERQRGAADPMIAEISELGTLVKQLAETVAAHEGENYRRIASDQGVPVTVTATAATPPTDAMPVAEAMPTPASPDVARRFAGLTRDGIHALIAGAVDANRIDLYLQPIVTLPQRKVRFYEAVSRLRTDDGDVIPAADFLEHAEAAGLMSKIDNLLLFRCVQVMRRLQLKNREVGLFCNVSPSTLADAGQFQRFLEFMDANRALAPNIVFEFGQAAIRNFGPIENEALAALAERGFRFSMDNLQDLRIEPRDLNERSFKFIKVPAKLLLNRNTPGNADIHAADLADLLARSGIDLIAERIESESMVVDLLDYDVRFGQGFLFSPPRPVRPEALHASENVDATAGPKAADEPLELKNELVAAGGRR